MLSPVWRSVARAQIKTPRLLLEPGRCGPLINAVISGSNDYTHRRPVPIETRRTTTTRAGRAALRVVHFSRRWNVSMNVHDSLPPDVRKLNGQTVPPLAPIVNANVDTVIGNT